MPYDNLTLELRGAIAEIRLNAPPGGRVVDASLIDEIDRAAAGPHDDDAVRVVLLAADTWDFSVAAGPGHAPLPFRSLELMAQPVIACLQGDVRDGGLELALACDIRFAAEDATFAIRDVALGAVPSLGGTQRLPRLIGRGKAAEMILLGDQLDAVGALACGLVNAVVPANELRTRAEELAARIAAQGPIAVRYAKEAISRGLDMPLEQALRYETDLTVILQTTADRDDGVRAFLDKRPPKFSGA